MKRSDLIRYISVAVICLLSGSVGQRPNAKSVCEAEDFNILSAFNLKADLIIQVLSKGVYEFWGIGDTETFGHKKSVSQDVRHRYYGSVFLPDPNTSFIFTHVNNVNFDLIDETKPLYGYVAPISREYGYNCHLLNLTNPSLKLDKDDCDELDLVYKDPNTNFVCIHGWKINKTQGVSNEKGFNVYRYNSSDGMLSHIERYALRLLVLDSCMSPDFYKKIDPSLDVSTIRSVLNWYESGHGFSHEYFKNITIFQPPNEYMVKLLVLRSRPVKPEIFQTDLLDSDYYDFSKYFYIFRFNSYYEFMVCGYVCDLDAPLNWLIFKEDRQMIEVDVGNGTKRSVEELVSKLEHKPLLSNITIRKMLGCPQDHQPPLLDPIQFCNKKRQIISIFSLGNDIYFQSTGRFWRSASNHFTEAANPELKSGNRHGIQFESDFTATVERELDTFSPVFGFSFLSNYFHECNGDENKMKACEVYLRLSGEYYETCIFGSKKIRWNEIMKVIPVSMALHITPYRITKAIGKPVYGRSPNYLKYFCEDLRSAEIDGQKGLGLMAVTELHTPNDVINVVYALYGTYNSKLVRYEWDASIEEMPKFFSGNLKKNTYDISDPPQFLFTFRTKEFRPLAYEKDEKGDGKLYELRNNNFLPKNMSFLSFINCPFNSDSTLVTVKKENVCSQQNPLLVESVFLIGSRHYHQIGQHFYVYDKNQKLFVYDVYSSKIFAKYFDTTHRLTGYSYIQKLLGKKQFEVMIHGKASEEYKHLGQYISALFFFDEVDLLLKVMNNRLASIFRPNVTFGAVSGFEKDGFIDAMAGGLWQYLKSGTGGTEVKDWAFLWFWVRELNNTKYQLIQDLTHLDILNDGKFDKFKRNWSISEIDMKDVPFEQLVGIFVDEGVMFIDAREKINPDVLREFSASKYDYSKGINQVLLLNISKPFVKMYHDKYCTSPAPPGSQSEASKTWNTVLAVLLLLNMIMALIVAFLTYQKNENKEGIPKSKSKETNSKKADTASND